MTPQIETLEKKIKEIDKKIEDVENRLPAHSVKPPIMTELFELEDEREAEPDHEKTLEILRIIN